MDTIFPYKITFMEYTLTHTHAHKAISRIEAALKSAQEQIADLDLYVLEHDTFGKGDVKKCKISPDGFVQMALQLAYYKVCVS